MTTSTTNPARRTRPARTKAATTKALVSADVPETDAEMEAIIDAPKRRRPTAKKSPAAPVAPKVEASVFLPEARHVADYTVDLMADGEEPTRDFSKMLAKTPSETHTAFSKWVKKHMDENIDPRTVQILISSYHEFQNDPSRKAHMKRVREAAAAKKAQALAKKATAAAPKK